MIEDILDIKLVNSKMEIIDAKIHLYEERPR